MHPPGVTPPAASVGPLFVARLDDPDVPCLAAAIHQGSELRAEVEGLLTLDVGQRRREEDPFTGAWTTLSPNRVVVRRSRFEVDLNRPPGEAVYLEPTDAWDLSMWRRPPPPEVVARSLEEHVRFYGWMRRTLSAAIARHGRVLVLDLHSYNHRRRGPHGPPAPAADNPELNLGTGTMNRARWADVVDAFLDATAAQRLEGRPVDVRENVRFRGGYFPRWVHETFPTSACALAIEVKKTFMDEWSGAVDLDRLMAWRDVLGAGAEAALDALRAGSRRRPRPRPTGPLEPLERGAPPGRTP